MQALQRGLFISNQQNINYEKRNYFQGGPKIPLFITAEQMAAITTRSLRTMRRIANEIREWRGEYPIRNITVDQFCEFLGIDKEDVTEHFQCVYHRGIWER